jgi:hypothetical protein
MKHMRFYQRHPNLRRGIDDNPLQGKGAGPMAPEENKPFIKRFVEEAINRKNLDALDGLVAENFVEHVPFPGQGPGRGGLRHAIGIFLSAFPDIHWVLDEQVAEGERVVSRFT